MERPALIVAAGTLRCALPLGCVEETMRPQPMQALRSAPAFVLGVAVVRGETTPVVDLSAVVVGAAGPVHRLVSLKTPAGRVALAVSEVVGVRDLDELTGEPLPALLGDARGQAVAALARLDGALVAVLDGARVVPDEVWSAEVG